MNVFDMNLIKTGLLAALPVVAITVVAIIAFSGIIFDNAVQAGEGGSRSSITASWAMRWAVVTLVFGVIAAYVYAFVSESWNWGEPQFIALALVMAVGLTVLEFVPMYETKYAPNWQLWTVLNFVYAVGFGYLIPKLSN